MKREILTTNQISSIDGSSLEQDVFFANLIADVMNVLVDLKVLPSSNLSSASNEIIEEFIIRFQGEIFTYVQEEKKLISKGIPTNNVQKKELLLKIFGNKLQRKIQVHFGVEREGSVFLNESGLEKEKAVNFLRELLRVVQESIPEVEGFLFFGSRADQRKTPDNISDLDIMCFLNSESRAVTNTMNGNFLDMLSTAHLWSAIKLIAIREGLTEYEIEMPFASFFDPFLREITSDLSRFKPKPEYLYWAHSPNSVKFIGSNVDFDESFINEKLSAYLSSTQVKNFRKDMMNRISKKILEHSST